MQGGSSPRGHAFLKAINSSFQKCMTNPLPWVYSSVLYSVFKESKGSTCYSWFHHAMSNLAHLDGQWVHARLPPSLSHLLPDQAPGYVLVHQWSFICNFIQATSLKLNLLYRTFLGSDPLLWSLAIYSWVQYPRAGNGHHFLESLERPSVASFDQLLVFCWSCQFSGYQLWS